MKVLLEIKDSKVDAFMGMLKAMSYVKAKPISEHDAEMLNEIKEIQLAFKHVDKIKKGKLKARPVEALFNEI